MIVLDTGALIGLEKGKPRCVGLLAEAVRRKTQIVVPATVLAQAWRNDPRQHPIRRLLKTDTVTTVVLDETAATAIGAVLAASGTADVVDAHVIVVARALRADRVVTADPDDLTALDPAVRLVVV
ncbi:PIN domain-containing protein [Nocardia speluncae]|uniref:PIN domain-containing protein n=1 Tax=Nocardia speluncae TaxID=419477 RepID=A0A846XKM2_9NOCA|nr:PIN domain-containing protein [Nocardia speluncae]NKY35819.1 PIN domain-containing protein [Nocardia speluncae]